MQRLFWIGSPFFSASLEACGWQVRFFNFEEAAVFGWNDLVRKAGWEPDVVVAADKSRPPFVLGMEDFPCVTVLYCVDTHIHSWYPLYAQAFDICMASLRDHLPLFYGKRLPENRVWWSPPFARDEDQPAPHAEKRWDCLFVGSTNPDALPRRARFLAEMGKRTPGLHVTGGDYRALFGHGRVLLNHCEHGDLNFRVFEAMGCGGCLLTPQVGHGLTDIFVDGEHMVTYEPDNVEDAATRLGLLLKNPELTQYIAGEGLRAVDAGHRAGHRAQAFTDNMCDIWMQDPAAMVAARRAEAAAIRQRWLRLPYLLLAEHMPLPLLREAYTKAAGGRFNAA